MSNGSADRPSSTAAGLERSVVLETCIRLVFHAIAATSLYFLFAGHNSPGGGFVGGLVAGSALVLQYLVSGRAAVGKIRIQPITVLGAGLLLAVGTSVAPWFVGGQVLQSALTYVDVPLVGAVPLASVLAFDSGVYLIVVGLVLTLLTTLAARPDASLGEIETSQSETGQEDFR